jgi:tetratricopeptide (TPR) repeat protein
MALARELYSEHDPIYGGYLVNLGVLYKYWGRLDEAQELYTQARSIFSDRPECAAAYATILYNQAGLAHMREEYVQAEPLARLALQLSRSCQPVHHPDIGIKAMALGAILAGLGNNRQAEYYYREALDIFLASFGKEHADIAVLQNNIGTLFRSEGRYLEAEAAYRDALYQRSRLLGEDHPQYAMTRCNLGVLLCETSRYAEGQQHLAYALPILVKCYGEGHPHTVACRSSMYKFSSTLFSHCNI